MFNIEKGLSMKLKQHINKKKVCFPYQQNFSYYTVLQQMAVMGGKHLKNNKQNLRK